MTEEDEEFQRLEREAKMRALEDDDIQDYLRPWVGLTEDDVASLCDFAYANDEEFVRNVEAKLKELNS